MKTRYKTKNENVEKAAFVEKELNEIRTYLSEKAKTGDKEAAELLEKFDAAVEEGKKAGINNVIKQIQDAINNNPSEFIIGQFKDLNPDNSYSSLNNVYHELQQLYNKSDLGQSLKTSVQFFRGLPKLGAKDIGEQEQTFKDKIKQAIGDGNIKDVMAWITTVNQMNKHVLEPAGGERNVRPDKATKILQNALDKLTHPEGQTQVEAQGNNQEQIQKQTQGGATKTSTELFAEATATGDLLAEMSKREKSIEKLITDIEKADTKLLHKANAAILQFSAESQAILNKVDLSDEEKEQLQKLQEQLNSVVEAKAKELKVPVSGFQFRLASKYFVLKQKQKN